MVRIKHKAKLVAFQATGLTGKFRLVNLRLVLILPASVSRNQGLLETSRCIFREIGCPEKSYLKPRFLLPLLAVRWVFLLAVFHLTLGFWHWQLLGNTAEFFWGEDLQHWQPETKRVGGLFSPESRVFSADFFTEEHWGVLLFGWLVFLICLLLKLFGFSLYNPHYQLHLGSSV